MKKNILSIFSLCALMGLSGCNAFLELEPLDKVSPDQLLETEGGVKALLANIYTMIPMEDFNYRPNAGFNQRGYDGVNETTNLAFLTDEATRSDGGVGIGYEGFNYWPYGDIRQVNIFMQNVEKAKEAGTISVADADRMTGEAHFARAYMYYGLVKRYGGVPLIDKVQDDDYADGGPGAVAVPRSTELDTWKFVLNECTLAAATLPDATSGSDLYRVTKWAAYALKSRVALHAASVAKYWNLAPLAGEAVTQKLVGGMTSADADAFYKECIEASKFLIENSGKSLYKPAPATVKEAASNFQALFLNDQNEEVIFSKAYLNGTTNTNQGHSYAQFNILPQVNPGALKYGRFNPMLEIVDLFEDYTDDGMGKSAKIVTRTDGNEDAYIANFHNMNNASVVNTLMSVPFVKYNDLYEPFANKDARLLASVVVPGSSYAGTEIIIQGGFIKDNNSYVAYSNESTQKNGTTYYALGAEGETMFSGFNNVNSGEDANWTATGFGVRKYMPEGESMSPDRLSSTTSYIDMRLAEVYLNYAEAVVENGSGFGDKELAENYLNALRRRAGHTDRISLTLESVLKERRVEMAFEGKRFWDMNRRREFHTEFSNNRIRKALVPMLDLRGAEPKYVFARVNYFGDETRGGRTFQNINYYRGIPNIATNGLVQNPGH
ncbi:RagB/SusD family nutrient uptake outer membrane protein [Bacteroides sp. AF35-22]|uniref:RagB/SusD family nutrient uptake outer membrane protein n=1 Tax=Bacteroides sp. AF35-22 TaxID=2292932 RepID=UPI000E769538|nr:RagB/SusD family nutrient uptake outer membrane protein [Bacteroides sp. AF35-22]RJW91764.1 RagB/SusD family nutrient uptake outer membrane protein [Bacteroides sp. AF35-22]